MAKYTINLMDLQGGLAVGETRDISRIGGLTIGEMQAVERGEIANLPANAMVGIVYVLIRRQNPRFTEADLNGMSWDDIDFVEPDLTGHDGTADPPQPLKPLKPGGRKSSGRSAATTE